MRRAATLAACVMTVSGAWGCAGGGRAPGGAGESGEFDTEAARASAANPFRAVRAELHALTRVVPASEKDARNPGPRIEAHVELLDGWGHGVRDLVTLKFELTGGPAGGGSDEGASLVWTVDLRDPDVNSKQFDRVTRTYVVPLLKAPDWVWAGGSEAAPSAGVGRGLLSLEALTADGRRLTSSRRLDR